MHRLEDTHAWSRVKLVCNEFVMYIVCECY